MSGVSIVRLAEQSSQPEEMASWLVSLDQDQDGKIQREEVIDPKGRLRCDLFTGRLGLQRWKSLEKVLQDADLIDHRRSEACLVKADKSDPDPVPPERRRPAEYAVQYLAESYDYVFALNPTVTLKKLRRFLKTRVHGIHQASGKIDVELFSGRSIKLELDGKGQLQKIHYLDTAGKYSLLARLEFLRMFRSAGVFEKFFAKNPYYEAEQEVWLRLYSPIVTSTEVPRLTPQAAKKHGWKGVLLVPDLHGNTQRYLALYHWLAKEKLDWFALEMLPQNLQPELDSFLSEPEKSKKFKNAKRRLQNYFQAFWHHYFPQFKDPDDNPYYRLLLLCRKRGIRVVALDAKISYTVANPKTAPLTVGTRNFLWAKQIPAKGRGIVFGGEAHFLWNRKARVQDFLLNDHPHRGIHLLDFGKKS